MNKEFNSNNYQDHPHQEGQQQNISHNRYDGENNPPSVERLETENDKANREEDSKNNKNNDSTKRQGNSSI